MFGRTFRRVLATHARPFVVRRSSIFHLSRKFAPSLASKRLYATIADSPKPSPVASLEQDVPNNPSQTYEPSEEYFVNFFEFATSRELEVTPDNDNEILAKVTEMFNRMSMFLMLHMRRPDQPLEEYDEGNTEAGMQYLEHLATSSAETFSHTARVRQLILLIHQIAIQHLKAIPSDSPALNVSLGTVDPLLPTFREAIYNLLVLDEPIQKLTALTRLIDLRKRVLDPDNVPEGYPPVRILPDTKQAELDARREDDAAEMDAEEITMGEKSRLLEDTTRWDNPAEFVNVWAPLWNDIVFADTVLNAFLSVREDPKQDLSAIRDALQSVLETRRQEMERLAGKEESPTESGEEIEKSGKESTENGNVRELVINKKSRS